ncbi:hypothetical protein SERLA73DRAFT_186855 [Serpula lacrymans var. lacrymans S7.3]|uniref:Uncharacterized protein n=1 Tax=Serpula lacrymans var. lacrymans (strain S7.3) TaxID=936435 RepID=F8Q7Z5_SERL3|nr:hypothetical protein SERLA73DRAFT_186855 [Serpula lacrymans var. lacrymans S7.3]
MAFWHFTACNVDTRNCQTNLMNNCACAEVSKDLLYSDHHLFRTSYHHSKYLYPPEVILEVGGKCRKPDSLCAKYYFRKRISATVRECYT